MWFQVKTSVMVAASWSRKLGFPLLFGLMNDKGCLFFCVLSLSYSFFLSFASKFFINLIVGVIDIKFVKRAEQLMAINLLLFGVKHTKIGN